MLTPAQLANLERADRELAELRRREEAAAAREKAMDMRGVVVVVSRSSSDAVAYRRRSGGRLTAEDINRDIKALSAVRTVGSKPAPVADFVVGVFKHLNAWERAPVFVHAQYARDVRKLAHGTDDARSVQMAAVDALSDAVAHVAGMHSTWSALHTAVRRLVNRLECGFGDEEDDIGSLQRLQWKMFQISAMVVTAYIIEQRGLKLNVAETVSGPAVAETPDAAQLRKEELRGAIARGDVVWNGTTP